MLTVTITKEINGRNVKVTSKPIDEDTIPLSKFNEEVQLTLSKLLAKE